MNDRPNFLYRRGKERRGEIVFARGVALQPFNSGSSILEIVFSLLCYLSLHRSGPISTKKESSIFILFTHNYIRVMKILLCNMQKRISSYFE